MPTKTVYIVTGPVWPSGEKTIFRVCANKRTAEKRREALIEDAAKLIALNTDYTEATARESLSWHYQVVPWKIT